MPQNPISGHTAGTNDGLRDGDHIISPSLTNIYEGLHGNGVLNPHDTAYGSGDRNSPNLLPGFVSGSNHQVTIKACSVILDGVPYNIDNGSGGDVTINLTDTTTAGSAFLTGTSTTALTTGKECLFAIIATSEGAKFVQSNVVTSGTGVYPSLAGTIADSYLTMSSVGTAQNKQSLVLATIRATFNAGALAANDLNLTIDEINDKRVFIRPSPFYLSPVTDGIVGSTDHLNTHTALEQIHGSGEHGDFGNNGVLWMSYNEVDNSPNLYFSAKDGSGRHTHLLGPNRIKDITGSANVDFDFDEAQVFICAASGAINLNPNAAVGAAPFPKGHTVIVSVPSGSAITFDSTGLNSTLTAGDAALFTYSGSAWKRVMVSATTTSNASGAVGLIQFSDGAGNHSSDANLFWTTASSTLTVNGKLTVTGLIDPTGLELTPVGANPGNVGANTLWLDSGASNALKHGTATVLNSASSVEDLSDVTDAGSGIIMSTSERTKLTGVDTGAQVTNAANVNAAIAGHSYATPTLASNDVILFKDTDDGGAVKATTAADIAALGGGGGGGGTAIADADADTKVDVETSANANTISMHTQGTERVLITNTAVTLGENVNLAFEGSVTNAHETTLTVTNPTADRTITLPNATGTVALTSNLYTDLNAVQAIESAASITLGGRLSSPATHIEQNGPGVQLFDPVTGNPIPGVFELDPGERGIVIIAGIPGMPAVSTIGLPDPSSSDPGDTYIIYNADFPPVGGGGSITIDRSGLGSQGGHGNAQLLNGAALNGTLPVSEAVTLIYGGDPAGGGAGWLGIGL
tara:strand:+ start:982 stop:3399 length:2418 start_codon:yes stop_codon:yes gene_type:complete